MDNWLPMQYQSTTNGQLNTNGLSIDYQGQLITNWLSIDYQGTIDYQCNTNQQPMDNWIPMDFQLTIKGQK